MAEWSLPEIFASLHNQIENELKIGREALNHPTDKGDAAETVWLEMLSLYLPKRYRAAKAHVVDSNGKFSQQIDVVVFDRQYSPFIFNFKDSTVVPAESIYAVFEVKPTIDSEAIRYAQDKVNSVRALHRTSLPIPNAGGKPYEPKTPFPILGGLLTFGTHSGVGTGKNRTRPLNHQLGDVKLQGLSMSWRRRLISCWAIVRASLLHGDGHSRPAPESPIDRGPVAGCWCKP